MTWRVDDVVSREGVRDARIHLSEVSFRLQGLGPRIHVRLFRLPGSKEVYCEQSYLLRVPGQAPFEMPPLPSDKDEAHALWLVVESMAASVEDAVRRGLEPADEWLIENRDF